MPTLESTLTRYLEEPGVEQVILLGRDGLVIRQLGGDPGRDEVVAAGVPALASACEALGEAAGGGSLRTAVIELDRGVLITVALSADVFLAVLLRPGVGFAELLRRVRADRRPLLDLL